MKEEMLVFTQWVVDNFEYRNGKYEPSHDYQELFDITKALKFQHQTKYSLEELFDYYYNIMEDDKNNLN